MGLAATVADRYLDALSRGRIDEVLAFFRDDGELHWRDRDFVGKAGVQDFYRDKLDPGGVVFTDRTFMEDGLSSMVMTTAQMAGGRHEEIVDVFRIDEDGAIAELRIFFRNYAGK
jgi:hypothetical protein